VWLGGFKHEMSMSEATPAFGYDVPPKIETTEVEVDSFDTNAGLLRRLSTLHIKCFAYYGKDGLAKHTMICAVLTCCSTKSFQLTTRKRSK
jgi:hypothetical protein